ncbi:MAG: tetratricopeptide repeat protein [Candidatus Electrothrix sp. EH2]|nr:tetratricopeptide repeat protein [Candidatus Electrothrix sp. EH2]
MGICWYQVGLLKESQGQYEEAEKPYKNALAIMNKAGNDIILADILDKLARLHMELEAEPDAVPLFERLLKIKKNSPAPDLAGIIIICNNIGKADRAAGNAQRRREQAAESVGQQGLAAAAGSEQSKYLPSIQAETDLLNNLRFSAARPDTQLLHLKQHEPASPGSDLSALHRAG